MKRTRKKWLWISGGVILVLLLIGSTLFLGRGEAQGTKEVVESKTLKTFFYFSGTLEAKDRQTVISDRDVRVTDVRFEEGDTVISGQTIISVEGGEDFKAPRSGQLVRLDVTEGEVYAPNTVLFVVADNKALIARLKIDEQDIERIEVEDTIELQTDASDKTIKGKVESISPEAVTENGSTYFNAKVSVPSSSNWLPGMTVEGRLPYQLAQDVPVLSLDVISYSKSDRPYVYVKKDGETTRQYIETGVTDGQDIEIKDGLSAGDEVFLPSEDGASGLLPTPPGGAS
ncbi:MULTISPECIES: HlyD family efflux transporter periplasmic adaptor subunit [Exiguobacterium]|uniref:HlyD family efflux transporter periplasmic adaptor subunit n=1 Tax=Exiguobacterium TaxID=33986 RepID=UPI0025C28DEF|nr:MULTISPECIES: HlyD family efflux transporter periplasmic adaptor subunit [Exiguobacterium]